MSTGETVDVEVALTLSGVSLRAEFAVPARPVALSEFLPLFRTIAEGVVARSVKEETAKGKAVSCRAGCGACCRQVVPLSEIEARQVRDLVDALPEPRRSDVRARFAEARRRLGETDLLAKLEHPERFADDDLNEADLGARYFALKVACPFLEDESCSIHPERPIACREYLVTSPAEHCAHPTLDPVDVVPLIGRVSTAVSKVGVDRSRRFTRWVPLVLALDWSETHPDDLGRRPGPDWLREFLGRLADKPPPP